MKWKMLAIEYLFPNAVFNKDFIAQSTGDEDIVITKWNLDDPEPTDKELEAVKDKAIDAHCMKRIREDRNKLLSDSDWLGNSDVVMSDKWKKYRQDLRDLPSTASPTLNEDYSISGVTWPTKPE